ncbi:MAG: outer membrane lipoprotein-sorting protein [candidate division WOR-3 bacterium]
MTPAVLIAGLLSAILPDAHSLLRRIDANAFAATRLTVATLHIRTRRGTRAIKVRTYSAGTDRSFSEYLSPERERGTKMLRLGSQLWLYSPQSDRTILISGHLLRQSVSGSDLSYEDLMDNPLLSHNYSAVTEGLDTVNGRPAWRLSLTGQTQGLAYPMRRLWVDAERDLIVREERYARSGRLLKTAEVTAMSRFENRWVVTGALFRDMLREGNGTELVVESLALNIKIPPHLFTKAALRR